MLNAVLVEKLKRPLLWLGFGFGVIFVVGVFIPALIAGARLAGLINPG